MVAPSPAPHAPLKSLCTANKLGMKKTAGLLITPDRALDESFVRGFCNNLRIVGTSAYQLERLSTLWHRHNFKHTVKVVQGLRPAVLTARHYL